MIAAIKLKVTGLNVRVFGNQEHKRYHKELLSRIKRLECNIKETNNANAMLRYWLEHDRLMEIINGSKQTM